MHAQRHGAIGVLRPRGVFNDSILADANDALASLRLTGRLMLVLDLAETMVLDSASLEWLLDLDDRHGQLGGGVRVAHGNELCQEILRLTGVGARIGVYSDLASALGSFSK